MSFFYAVKRGRKTGIYRTWADCSREVHKFAGARYKKFSSQGEAEAFVHGHDSHSHSQVSGRASKVSQQRKYYSERPSHCPVVYSDGSCLKNGFSGASAGVGVYWGPANPYNRSEKLSGKQTNQRAEIVAACRAVETAVNQKYDEVELRTDSLYTIKAVTEWVVKWSKNGWKTANGEDVKNKDDFVRLNNLCQQVKVHWVHVPGHKGVEGNEEADRLARAAATSK